MLAKWLATEPDLLIVDEPTYGVDIGARYEIYRLLRSLADAGKAILLISSDLEEIVNETDRVVVMYKGRVTGEFPQGTTRHALMAAATGQPISALADTH
jgi:ABC-type sugar transport system ATPase subunit